VNTSVSPSSRSDFTNLSIAAFLENLSDMSFTGAVLLEPSAIKLRFKAGLIVAAVGAEPLGSILVRRGVLTETQLADAIFVQQQRSLGEVLTKQPFNVAPDALLNALETQVKLAVNLLLSEKPLSFTMLEDEVVANQFSPQVRVQDALLEASSAAKEVEAGVLALSAVLRMRLQCLRDSVQLTNEQWAVCALLNGRRTLSAVMRHFEVTHLSLARESARLRAYRAAVQLLQLELIEPAAVNGLQTLVMRKLNVPRTGINAKAALFLDALDGVQSAYQIAQVNRLELTDAAGVVTNLYRNNFAAVQHGKRELERLLEEY
jgi:hypothetical protein